MTVSKYTKLAAIAGGVVVADQVTKALVLSRLPLYRTVEVLPGFFNLTHLRNPGGAFGFLAGGGGGLRVAFFLAGSLLAVALLGYFYRKLPPTHPWLGGGLCLILGGAVGNLIDRLRFKAVVDFLDVFVGDLHWPAFNVADSAITIGVVIFAYHILFNKLPDE